MKNKNILRYITILMALALFFVLNTSYSYAEAEGGEEVSVEETVEDKAQESSQMDATTQTVPVGDEAQSQGDDALVDAVFQESSEPQTNPETNRNFGLSGRAVNFILIVLGFGSIAAVIYYYIKKGEIKEDKKSKNRNKLNPKNRK